MKYLPLLLLPLTLAACSSPAPENPGTDTAATDTTPAEAPAQPATDTTTAAPAPGGATSLAASAPPAAKICLTCHKVDKGAGNTIGPNLFGMFGQKSGQVAGYAYTEANKNSGHVWDEPTLDKYLTAPMKDMPGTKMAFAGYPDAAKRKEVIDWMKTLK